MVASPLQPNKLAKFAHSAYLPWSFPPYRSRSFFVCAPFPTRLTQAFPRSRSVLRPSSAWSMGLIMARCAMGYGVAGVAQTFSDSDLGRSAGCSNCIEAVPCAIPLYWTQMSGIALVFVRWVM
ncbi:hypothetical protein IE4872_CH03351 [Rhizobium gallicum]|uniref:Uncharacterized protein n=1 Tax=Rhizobium gallicum TaxID=56730 RepID=A0A1L5NM15_9HYPH|nr:hypothetical protein IE4872_CH03351 [Rhizobium gallicum]